MAEVGPRSARRALCAAAHARPLLLLAALASLLRACGCDDVQGWDAAQEAAYTGVAVVTSYDERFADMATLSLANKRDYCVHQGYPLVVRTGTYLEMDGRNVSLRSALDEKAGLIKCGLLHEMFRRFPNCSWVFICESDQVITNPNIKLEKFTEGARHFIAAADLNAPNAGSFFLRNSPLGRAFLDTMCAASPIYKLSGWFENMFILDMYHTSHFREHVMTVLPQKSFNSYDAPSTDILGTPALWSSGDFMAHFAGADRNSKLRLVQKYLALVLPFDSATAATPGR